MRTNSSRVRRRAGMENGAEPREPCALNDRIAAERLDPTLRLWLEKRALRYGDPHEA